MKDWFLQRAAMQDARIASAVLRTAIPSVCLSAGGSSVPLTPEWKGTGTDPHWKHVLFYSYSAGGATSVSSCTVKIRCRNENFDP